MKNNDLYIDYLPYRHFINMLRFVLLFLSYVLTLSVLSGCSQNKLGSQLEEYRGYSAQQLLTLGERKIAKQDLEEANKYLEALVAFYPFSPEAYQGQLDAIFVNYQNSEYDLARAAADRFIQLYPASPDTDYAYYLKGLSFLKRNHLIDKSIWHSGQYNTLDSSGLIIAYHAFYDLVTRFPKSSYATDAVGRMYTIREILAEHELYLARFYWRRGAYVAAINRAIPVIKQFSALPQTQEALEIIEDSYRGLGLTEQAQRTRQVIEDNYGPHAPQRLQDVSKYGSAARLGKLKNAPKTNKITAQTANAAKQKTKITSGTK